MINTFLFTLALFLFIALRRPMWLPTMLLLVLPTYQLRVALGPIPTTFLEAAVLGSIVGRGLALLISKQKKPERLAQKPWSWLAVALVMIGVLTLFYAPDTRAAFGLWKAYLLEPVLLFLLMGPLLHEVTARRYFVRAAGLLLLVLGAVTLLQYTGALPSPEPWISENPKRVTGFFEFPNAVGLLAAPLLGLLLGLLLSVRKVQSFLTAPEKWFVGSSIAFGIVAILLANVRGALLGVAAALIFCLWFTRRRWLWYSAVGVVLAGSLLSPTIRATTTTIIALRDTSADVRVALWQGTWNLLKHRPIQGTGLAGFPIYYEQYKLDKHVELLQYPHNIFLNFWTELGLMGLAWVVIFFGFLKWKIYKSLRTSPTLDPFTVAVAASFLTVVIYGLVDVPYFKNDLAILWWLVVSLL